MELTVSKDFIWAILNESLLEGNQNLRLKSDLLDTRILEFDMASNEITRVCPESEFDKVVSRKRLEVGEDLGEEIPDYIDFRDALWSSLALPPENLDQLMEELKELEKRKKHPYRYPKERLFAIDTNIAYLRLFSRLTLLKGSDAMAGYDPGEVPIVILGLVEDEVSNRVQKKLGKADIRRLTGAVGRREARSMINCLHKRGRKALNAQTEIRSIREEYGTRGLQGGEFLPDKEERDEEMARTLSEYMSGQKVEIIFLTNDDKSRAHTYAYRIPAIELKYPHEFETPIPCDQWLITELVYDLVITFGILSLEGLGVRILGVWPGKDANDYLDQRLRVEVEDGASIAAELRRSYQILNDLNERYDLDDID